MKHGLDYSDAIVRQVENQKSHISRFHPYFNKKNKKKKRFNSNSQTKKREIKEKENTN